jgi:alpha-L-rhamnosidase
VAGNDLTLDVSIPVNTTATIYFPLTEDRQILEDELSAAKASGVLNYRRNSHGTIIDIGSGHYHFVSER